MYILFLNLGLTYFMYKRYKKRVDNISYDLFYLIFN